VTSTWPKILVVEDEPIVRNLIVDVLTRQGWLVFEADNVVEAQIVCTALKDELLDLLIIADQSSLNGARELTGQILAHCPNVKVLNLADGPAVVSDSNYLQKPFTGAELIHAVQSLLNPRTQ
jgi:DNA-binding NtrC family response regulator